MRRAIVGTLFGCVMAALLISATGDRFTRQDKAYFADPKLINFVRPGLVVKITGASIASNGTIQAQLTVSDPQGLGLDVQGVTTPGTISTSFVASYIPTGGSDYTAITTRSATGATGTVNQPATDTGGTLTNTADGQYTYTFGTKAPSGLDPGATVSIGMWASRDLMDFDLGINSANSVFSFVPNGSAASASHDVVHTQTCNKCHDPLQAHGGARRQVELCVLCHNPGGPGVQTVDPDTGNSIDFKVMVHKIHMGSELPSVKAGQPYQIIGFNNSVNDFSDVVFPADTRNCQMCHETGAPPQGGTAPAGSMTTNTPPPAQGDWWLTHPTRAACGSCHDNVNFATGQNHPGGPEVNDNTCAQCHAPQGELPFDASILGAHTIPQFADAMPGVVFSLVGVANGTAGSAPTVTFTIKDKAGNAISPADMANLSLVMAGPTADYASVISESARGATGSGTYSYTFQSAIPANATRTYTIGIEGYRNITLLPGTVTQQVVRDAGHNQIINFSVDGSPVTPHPVEVSNANCNQCHYSIQAHGGIRNETQYCVLCHNPNGTDQARRPANQAPTQSIDFPVLIHRLHRGEDAPAGGQLTPFVIYGFNGSPNDFSDVAFPGDLRDCAKCHVNNSQQLPLPGTRIPVQNPQAFFSPMGPTTAACTACHTSRAAVAHAQTMATGIGESCAVCHGPNADFSVDRVHARTL